MKYLKAGKSRKTCLTNHTQPISHHITPLVINAHRGGYTDRHTHTDARKKYDFKKPGARGRRIINHINKLCIAAICMILIKVCISAVLMEFKLCSK